MDERVTAIAGGDTGLQQRYLYTIRRSEFLTPIKLLVAAILEDAIHLYRKYQGATDRAGKEKFHEVDSWIMRHGNNWIFSFDNVCELLGLDPDFVRRSLRQSQMSPLVGDHRAGRRSRHRQAA